MSIVEEVVQTKLCIPVVTEEVAIQTESIEIGSKTTQTEDVPPYTPLVVEAIIRKMRTELAEL